MGDMTHNNLVRRSWIVLGGALGAVALLALLFFGLNTGSESASAATGGPEMVLNIKGGNCDDPVRPTKCTLPTGASFTLSVDALGIPVGGYDLIATAMDLGTKLIYTPTASAADDFLWPDVQIATRGTIGTVVVHGGLTGLFPPLPVSPYVGNIVEIALACPVTVNDSPVTIPLLPLGHPNAGTSGSQFQLAGASTIPKLTSLTISCTAPTPTPTDTFTPTPTNTPTITPTPTITNTPTITPTKQPLPGDTDGDGCPDQRENGPDETMGGQRNYKDPWDYYDVNFDGFIDLPNDILGVIQHFAPLGTEPTYDVLFDRGPQIGPNSWNAGPPDGVIDLPNDILGVIKQFFHNCA